MTNYGSGFTETELLLAALYDDEAEVARRVRDMLPGERRSLQRAMNLISEVLDEIAQV